MRILRLELKKLFDWKICLVILVLGALTTAALLMENIDGYNSMTKHGVFGSFLREMFQRYGESLEPEEYADYDIDGRVDE